MSIVGQVATCGRWGQGLWSPDLSLSPGGQICQRGVSGRWSDADACLAEGGRVGRGVSRARVSSGILVRRARVPAEAGPEGHARARGDGARRRQRRRRAGSPPARAGALRRARESRAEWRRRRPARADDQECAADPTAADAAAVRDHLAAASPADAAAHAPRPPATATSAAADDPSASPAAASAASVAALPLPAPVPGVARVPAPAAAGPSVVGAGSGPTSASRAELRRKPGPLAPVGPPRVEWVAAPQARPAVPRGPLSVAVDEKETPPKRKRSEGPPPLGLRDGLARLGQESAPPAAAALCVFLPPLSRGAPARPPPPRPRT